MTSNIATSNISTRTWRTTTSGEYPKVKTASNLDKILNSARGFSNLTSIVTGAAAAAWGAAKLATQFAVTTNRVTSYWAAKSFATYAIPLNMAANAVRVGLEYKTITNVSRAKKNSGAGIEALVSGAGLLSTIFNGTLRRNSVNYPLLKNVPACLTAIGVGIAAYNAWTSYPAINDDAINESANEAARQAKAGLDRNG